MTRSAVISLICCLLLAVGMSPAGAMCLPRERLPAARPDATSILSGWTWFPPANETITYDASGNRESTALWTYRWNSRNQLVTASTKDIAGSPEGWQILFDYDAEGRRFKKTVRHKTTATTTTENIYFIWDGWNLIYERHENSFGTLLWDREYVWGEDLAGGMGGSEGAGGAGGLLLIRERRDLRRQTHTDYYPCYDTSGHVVALTDTSGAVVATYDYGPFGELLAAKGPAASANPFRYATKYFDEETGLYYFGHRYYDPQTGQWLSREPLGESESLNLYSYCHNDPMNRVDVLGLKEQIIAGSAPVLFTNPENDDLVFIAFPLEENGWFRPFAPNGKHSFVRIPISVGAAKQFVGCPEFIETYRNAAVGQLEVTHANAKVFYIRNSIELVGGVGEMAAGIVAAPESACVSLGVTVHGADVTITRWQRLWSGPGSDIQSQTSQILQLIPGVDRHKAEIGDGMISFATIGGTMYVLGKAPLVYVPRMVSPCAETIGTSSSGGTGLVFDIDLAAKGRGLRFAGGEGAENYLRQITGGAKVRINDIPVLIGEHRGVLPWREIDALAEGIAHESKVGFVKWTPSIKWQILKDAAMVREEVGQVSGAHWHCWRSDITGRIGANPRVLSLLRRKGITYTIHE